MVLIIKFYQINLELKPLNYILSNNKYKKKINKNFIIKLLLVVPKKQKNFSQRRKVL